MLSSGRNSVRAIADVVVSQVAGTARAARHHGQSATFCRLSDHPFVIGRNRHGETFSDFHGRGTVHVAQVDGVIRAASFRFFFEQDFLAVAADGAQFGPPEPPEFFLLFGSRREPTDADTLMLATIEHDPHCECRKSTFLPGTLEMVRIFPFKLTPRTLFALPVSEALNQISSPEGTRATFNGGPSGGKFLDLALQVDDSD